MRVVIVVRSSPNYDALTAETFKGQLRTTRFVPNTEVKTLADHDVLSMWNKCFSMSFLQYRKGLAGIARQTIDATGCEVVRAEGEFTRWWPTLAEDVILVPVDDDDWFAPNLNEIDAEFDGNTTLLTWNKTTYKNYNTAKVYVGKQFRMASNNWAVRSSWLKEKTDERATVFMLGSHAHSELYVRENMDPSVIKTVDKCWSVYNRHCASLAFLRALCDDGTIDAKLREIAARQPSSLELPDNLKPWAEPYVKQIERLNSKLRRRLMC